MAGGIANDEVWKALINGTDTLLTQTRRRNKRIPGSPRCKQCYLPLAGPFAWALKLRGLEPSRGNPNFCNNCEVFVRSTPGGVEAEVTLLFADVRGSTAMAEGLSPTRFTALMNRFFAAAGRVLINSDAFIDKLVGDQIIGIYMPFVGPGNPRRAIEAAEELLIATGHRDATGPWLPVGVGVNTGVAFVGLVGTSDGKSDFTAMGDVVNVTARFSSHASAGEILVGMATWEAAAIESDGVEHRRLEVKGKSKPIDVNVLKVTAEQSARSN